MTITFYLRFHTKIGETLLVSGDIEALGNDKFEDAFSLTYFNNEFWRGTIELPDNHETESVSYKYVLLYADGTMIIDGENDRLITIDYSYKSLVLIDTWNHAGLIENVFYTQPFKEILLAPLVNNKEAKPAKHVTHVFKVKAPLLQKNETLCIAGSGNTLQEWNLKKPLLLSQEGNWFYIELNMKKEKFPITYKYGIYDTKEKTIQTFETGKNRILYGDEPKKTLSIIHDGFINIRRTWKGAGVSIPVFSLRSKNSFGVGEFTDIKLLVDWAKLTGLKLIQILPINDTSATGTWLDSYPYAAISAFALHPLYINLSKVAGAKHMSIIKSLNKKQNQLNELKEIDYEEVMTSKMSVLKELFSAQKKAFKNNTDYFEFFEINRHWLMPYAVFSFLKEKNKTADFTKWKANKIFNEEAIQQLASPGNELYDEICFYYFIQYHLHLQLKDAVDYAHEQAIVLKGDIPIGVYRYGADTWVNPELFNMNEQAGAPPDDFAVKGQNWGFPTYNWQKMKQDDFAWWRQRFDQMSVYFDAFRIDHILGFFRIWSIPLQAVEGILGRFVPAVPVYIEEFSQNGIWFDYNRYCTPFITEAIVKEFFGEQSQYVKDTFLKETKNDFYELKEEYSTQRKVDDYFTQQHNNSNDQWPTTNDQPIKEGLFNLISNVILIEEEGSDKQRFHFRISIDQTISYQSLETHTQYQLRELYINYFFRRQDEFWKKEAMAKLPELKRSTNMLICGEDLGMVPGCVPDVMNQLGILTLEIQRMPKDPQSEFFHPRNAPYLSVVTPSTHDMSTIRGWWEEDRNKTQHFYNYILGRYGEAPYFCEPWINKEIILQHLYSPAMWSIFQLQDLLGMSSKLRRDMPQEERINIPAEPKHYWRYRMHINLEDLIKEEEFNEELRTMVKESGR